MAHIAVLVEEVLAGLALGSGAVCIDGTLGGAGHAEALLQVAGPTGRLLGLDRDPTALEIARARLAEYSNRAVLVQASFVEMAAIAARTGFTSIDGILLDLGISSWQLDEPERGFSFQGEGPLDMRMDPAAPLSAADIVNDWSQEDLAGVIYRFGEEPRLRRIARAIVAARPLSTTTQLAEVVRRAIGGPHTRIHPATRIFQALRIAVNGELDALRAVLPQMVSLLKPGGRFAVITFHSLEDRIVKQFVHLESRDCICPPDLPVCVCGHKASLRAINRKPLQAADAEVVQNSRSRSAKLRVAEKLGQ